MAEISHFGRQPADVRPVSAAAGLGFAGFFFPLLQPMFGMVGQPAIRQQQKVWTRTNNYQGREQVGKFEAFLTGLTGGRTPF